MAPTEKPTVPLEDLAKGINRFTFGWMNPLIKRAVTHRNLTPNDLHPAHPSMQSINCGRQFALEWNKKRWEMMQKKKDELPVVLVTLYRSFIKEHAAVMYSLFPFLFATSMIAPLMIQFLIIVVEAEASK